MLHGFGFGGLNQKINVETGGLGCEGTSMELLATIARQ